MKHLVISDTQVKPKNSVEHLSWLGQYIVDKKPDVIVHIGDHWDMQSLSVYDIGKKGFEGRSYVADIEAGNKAMDVLMAPLIAYNNKAVIQHKPRYKPDLIFTLGNHENRIERAIESDRKLEGLISYDDFNLEEYGWQVVPYLQPIIINDIAYCHYFTSGVMGRPVSSARLMLNRKHMSCVMGHVQDRDIAYAKKADGNSITGIFAGIYYQHDEEYLNPQTNTSWRGVWMLHDVKNGGFDEMPISLSYLEKRYALNK